MTILRTGSCSPLQYDARMCGRFTFVVDAKELAAHFDVEAGPFKPRYNIAPSQDVPIIRLHRASAPGTATVVRQGDAGEREVAMLRWGLIPHWAKDAKIQYRTINARAETVATQPAFREAFRKRRCIVPASGFYEWSKTDDQGKQPYYIQRKDETPLAFAGLWERWTGPDGATIESFTIITTSANDLIAPFHDRMPVILASGDFDAWLDSASPADALKALLRPFASDQMKMTRVSKHVNSPRNDDPDCVAGVD